MLNPEKPVGPETQLGPQKETFKNDDFIELLEGLAHDLRNVSSTIQMNTALLKREFKRELTSDIAEPRGLHTLHMVERMEEASSRMESVMQDSLDMARFMTGSLVVQPGPKGAKALIRNALMDVEAFRAEKEIEVETQGASEGIRAMADSEKVPKALSRFLRFALKSTPPQSKIVLTVDEVRDEVNFRVKLTVGTLPAQKIESIFERRDKKIGLALVKALVSLVGGRTHAETLPEGGIELSLTLQSASSLSPP